MAPIDNFTYVINPQPIRLSNSILNGEFNDDILDILIPNLVPNFNKLDFLSHEVHY